MDMSRNNLDVDVCRIEVARNVAEGQWKIITEGRREKKIVPVVAYGL